MGQIKPNESYFKKWIFNKRTKEIKEVSLHAWAEWMEKPNSTKIKLTKLKDKDGIGNDIAVSTIFLGLDHGFRLEVEEGEEYLPVLFETRVFGGELDREGGRYCTYDEAIAGHKEMVERVKFLEKTLGKVKAAKKK